MDTYNQSKAKWLYIGRDDGVEYGPFTSCDMITWMHHNFFHDDLRLKTDKDERYFTLAEWIRACGNRNPFMLPIESMDMLVAPLNNNTMVQVSNACFSLSGTPSSTPTPAFGVGGPGGPEQQMQQQQQPGGPPGFPVHLVHSSPGPVHGHPIMLMNIPPPPPPQMSMSGEILRANQQQLPAANGVHPMFSPPNQPLAPVSLVPISMPPGAFHHQQFVQQSDGRVVQMHPAPAPPLHVKMPFPSQQMMFSPMQLRQQPQPAEQRQHQSSDSPDSGHVVTPYAQQHDMNVDTSDAPWNQPAEKVHKSAGPDTPIVGHTSAGMQTDRVKISAAEAEKHISQLLGGIRVEIISQQISKPPP